MSRTTLVWMSSALSVGRGGASVGPVWSVAQVVELLSQAVGGVGEGGVEGVGGDGGGCEELHSWDPSELQFAARPGVVALTCTV